MSNSKRFKILNYLSLHSPDIVFLTETWLKPKNTNTEIFPLNCPYSVTARVDRACGVLVEC